MAETKIGSSTTSDFANTQTDFSVDAQTTDGATGQGETRYQNTLWTSQLGYFKKIPEVAANINAKATWTVGKGFTADPKTTFICDKIKGWGKDTFNTILENMIRTYHIGGDAYAEIIRDKEGNLINIKTLPEGSIVIVANEGGLIKRYEQTNKTPKAKNRKIAKEDIFHLARNRVADEIHGVSIISVLEEIILMKNQAMNDYKILLHRNVCPIRIWHLDTDDKTEIAAFKDEVKNQKENFEDMFITKGAVVPEISAIAANATLNPLPWINFLVNNFSQQTGVPGLITGNSQSLTEASAKMEYLVFQQTIEEEQLYIEEQVGAQLGLEIELEFPADLTNDLLSDKKKDGEETAATPNDTTAEVEGRK